ncbi:MAG: helicase [Verrucomicrobia bacterium]|nr:helicase [Verrucomicrobiota bacterium]
MDFSLDQRTASLSVGEFSDFSTGPRDTPASGAQGIWRAQLGTHWHNELRAQATADVPATEFEIPITGQIFHQGWTITLTGRIDQLLRSPATLREIKTVTRPLPADETELRRDYPSYFVQLATYAALWRQNSGSPTPPSTFEVQSSKFEVQSSFVRSELCFVEVGSGLAQTVTLTPADDTFFRVQLERVAEFLNLRLRARERLRHLAYRSPFATLRPGQETTQHDLTALFERQPLVLFEAPTGFGKTGVLLEFALGQLRSGHFDRALYLTSKSTGQLQVVRTLQAMTVPDPSTLNSQPSTPVTAWHTRNKAEHCINSVFHCVRDQCDFLAGAPERWPTSGLARFYLDEKQARDLDTLRAAGRAARICPYEITRAALAFNDVWIGDYNYVFAPANRTLFTGQPGYDPARTLLLLDEAHNLPSRVADAYSHVLTATDAQLVLTELHRLRVPTNLVTAWGEWAHFLNHLRATSALPLGDEDDARHLLAALGKLIPNTPLDLAELGPVAADLLWRLPSLHDELTATDLPRLWWSPRDGELHLTCLDAAPAIGATLREFGGVVLASATLTPVDGFSAACGLALETSKTETPAPKTDTPAKLGVLTKRDTKKLFRQLTSAAELLRIEETRTAAQPALIRAITPWRDGAYRVAYDARVDTTFQHRSQHYTTTAATIRALASAAQPAPVAVFFPSYAYAESIRAELAALAPTVRVSLQPKLRDLAAQSAWVESSLPASDALFLVLGSSFAEGIDALGGRITHAMVVGPALPEVNAVQRARLAEATRTGLTRDESFRRVYQIPGMIKVNQALGRLVRAPGQQARVILHCRRFLDPGYTGLLAPEYQNGTALSTDADLTAWLL